MKKISVCLLFITIVFISCVSEKSAKTNQEYNFSKSYYEKLGSNINRLIEMRKGVFGHYQYDSSGLGDKLIWPVNNGADSILSITRAIGNPAKDGHWTLLYMFMTHAPDLPLVVAFQKYEISAENRDSITSTNYFNDDVKVTWEQISDPNYKFNDIDFKVLKRSNDYISFVKKGLLEYAGETNLRYMQTPIEGYNSRKDYYTVTPQNSTFRVILYSDSLPPFNEPAIQSLEKLPKTNPFYPNCTAYPNK